MKKFYRPVFEIKIFTFIAKFRKIAKFRTLACCKNFVKNSRDSPDLRERCSEFLEFFEQFSLRTSTHNF